MTFRGRSRSPPEEHEDDRRARLTTAARRELIHDCTDIVVFAVLMLGIVAVGVIAFYEGFWDAAANPDTKRWSQTILSAVMAGGLSFVAGRKIGSK